MHSDIRTKIVNILSNKINWEGRQLEKINGMSRFAYEAIKAYLNGPNKTVKLFYDDVQVVIETDPLTQLDLIYLERKTEQSRVRITSLQDNYNALIVGKKTYKTIKMYHFEKLYEHIEDIESNLDDLVSSYVSSYEDQFSDDIVYSYFRACDFLSTEEVEAMRAEFGFDKPVTQDSDDDDSDVDDSDDDRNERIFSENKCDILDWIRETKSYESWAGDNYNVAIDQIDLENFVLRQIDIEQWQDQVLEDYRAVSDQLHGSIFEWTNGTLAEEWVLNGDDEYEDDFESDRPGTSPSNTYYSSSFIEFYDTFQLQINFSADKCESVLCEDLFLQPFDQLIPFLNPNANVLFDINTNVSLRYNKDDKINLGSLINIDPTIAKRRPHLFPKIIFHFRFSEKLNKTLITLLY